MTTTTTTTHLSTIAILRSEWINDSQCATFARKIVTACPRSPLALTTEESRAAEGVVVAAGHTPSAWGMRRWPRGPAERVVGVSQTEPVPYHPLGRLEDSGSELQCLAQLGDIVVYCGELAVLLRPDAPGIVRAAVEAGQYAIVEGEHAHDENGAGVVVYAGTLAECAGVYRVSAHMNVYRVMADGGRLHDRVETTILGDPVSPRYAALRGAVRAAFFAMARPE